jgi:hypothetical protein
LTWAEKWHSLGSMPIPSAEYNSTLQLITEQFVRAGLAPTGSANGSSIGQVRTNEIAFDPNAAAMFELREHKLQCRPGVACGANDKLLRPSTTAQTPANNLDFTSNLRIYLDEASAAILAGAHEVPQAMLGGASRGVTNPFGLWMPDDTLSDIVSQADTRRLFALSTCNGCHRAETMTAIFHIKPRAAGAASGLSGFLSGAITVDDPLGGPVSYDEPLRRKCEAAWLLNGNSTLRSTTSGRPH